MERNSRDDMLQLAKEKFDLIYDNICFTPQEAYLSVEAFQGQDVRYVMTSSGSVYVPASNLAERDFRPKMHQITPDATTELSYAEGKRQAEAVFAQFATFPSVYVRFPIVIGIDDYSRRLLFHIRKIANKEPFYLPNPQVRLNFIRSDEAADFLRWAGTKTHLTGPINATSDGTVSMRQLLEIIRDKTNGEIIISADASEAQFSPYGFRQDFWLNNDYAKSQGFEFQNIHNWLPQLVDQLSSGL